MYGDVRDELGFFGDERDRLHGISRWNLRERSTIVYFRQAWFQATMGCGASVTVPKDSNTEIASKPSTGDADPAFPLNAVKVAAAQGSQVASRGPSQVGPMRWVPTCGSSPPWFRPVLLRIHMRETLCLRHCAET